MESNDNKSSNFENFQHLNLDLCLELIFPFLGFIDLVNAADSCKQMRSAAENIFERKYKRTRFIIKIYYKSNFPPKYSIRNNKYQNEVEFEDFRICFKVLRCFGRTITKLRLQKIECDESFGQLPTYLYRYIVQFCANYLKELEFKGGNFNFGNLQVSFPSVEHVRFFGCNLDRTITKFNERFPKMRSLEFLAHLRRRTKVDDQTCIVEHFPHLEHLHLTTLHTVEDTDFGVFQEKFILAALKLNPNVRSLTLLPILHFGDEFLQTITEVCKSLETIVIGCDWLHLKSKCKTVFFKDVRFFEMQFFRQRYCNEIYFPIPFRFDSLTAFDCKHFPTLTRNLFDFVRNNPTITKLTFSSRHHMCNLSPEDIIKMHESFAFIREIEFDDFHNWRGNTSMKMNNITTISNSCRTLQKLILNAINNNYSYDNIVKIIKLLPSISWTFEEKKLRFVGYKSVQIN